MAKCISWIHFPLGEDTLFYSSTLADGSISHVHQCAGIIVGHRSVISGRRQYHRGGEVVIPEKTPGIYVRYFLANA